MVFRHEVDNITDGHSSHVWKVRPKYIAYILAKSVERKVLKSLAQWRQKTISWYQLKVFDYIELNMKFCKLRSLIRVRKKDKTGNDHWLPADECLSHTCPPSFITYYQWVTSWWPCTSFILSLQVKIDKKTLWKYEWKLTHKLLNGEIVTVKKNKAHSQPCIKSSAVKVTTQLVCMC